MRPNSKRQASGKLHCAHLLSASCLQFGIDKNCCSILTAQFGFVVNAIPLTCDFIWIVLTYLYFITLIVFLSCSGNTFCFSDCGSIADSPKPGNQLPSALSFLFFVPSFDGYSVSSKPFNVSSKGKEAKLFVLFGFLLLSDIITCFLPMGCRLLQEYRLLERLYTLPHHVHG